MSKPLAVVLVASALLVLPAQASAACHCQLFARTFAQHATRASHRFDRTWRHLTPRPPIAGRIITRVHKERLPVHSHLKQLGRYGHYKPKNWCAENWKVCRAVIVCAVQGGGTCWALIHQGVNHVIALNLAVDACVAAAIGTIEAP
jgi:hypothetical protein